MKKPIHLCTSCCSGCQWIKLPFSIKKVQFKIRLYLDYKNTRWNKMVLFLKSCDRFSKFKWLISCGEWEKSYLFCHILLLCHNYCFFSDSVSVVILETKASSLMIIKSAVLHDKLRFMEPSQLKFWHVVEINVSQEKDFSTTN